MFVHALVASIRTNPEPTVLLVLDGLNKVLANFLGSRPRVAVLAENNFAKFLFVPFVHCVALLRLLLLFLRISRIGVEILLGRFPLNVQIMTELALLSLFTVALLVEDTQDGLRVDTKRNLLNLHGLEQLQGFLLCSLSGLLLGFTAGLLSLLLLGFGGLVVCCLSLELCNLLLRGTTFFL